MLIRKKEPWSRFALKAGAGLAITLSIMSYATSRWEIGIDPQTETSLLKQDGEPARVFLVDKRTGDEISTGDIVVLHIPDAAQAMMTSIGFTYPTDTMAKRVVAKEGDRVVVTDNGVYVNDRQVADGLLLAEMFVQDRESLHREMIIPPGAIYVIGDAVNSFDSRYWGEVPASLVKGKATILF